MSDHYEIWHEESNADHQKGSMLKNKKNENPRWPPTPLFFVVLGIAPWSNPWPILASNTSKRVFWAKEVPFGVQKDKYFSFDP